VCFLRISQEIEIVSGEMGFISWETFFISCMFFSFRPAYSFLAFLHAFSAETDSVFYPFTKGIFKYEVQLLLVIAQGLPGQHKVITVDFLKAVYRNGFTSVS
jgi:hypothetical protein